MTYICAPIFVDLPLDNGVTVEFNPSLAPVVPIPGGPKGLDGVSPIITVTDILGGHKVTITDKDGTETFDVMDGGISQEDFLKVFPQDIASGSVASFPDGADGVPVVDLTVDITPVQSGSGDPSPSNVRPISGWSVTNVHISPTLDPQDGTTLTFDLDGVRYGGTLNVLTGVLTVDYTGGVLNGSEGWQRGSGATWFYRGVSGTYRTGVTPAYTSHFKSVYNQVNAAWMIYGQIHVYPDTTIAPSGNTAEGLAEFKAWLAQNNVDFYTKLVTPLVIQLTPQEVETLLGTNNIWADTGNTTVKYRADTGLYVQKLTGSTEEDMKANVSIASGKYFLVGNALYLSTTSIPAGDTIKPGTNCTLTNLAAALNALNS